MAIIDLDKNEIISKLKADNKNLAKINNKPLQIKRGNKANLPQLADGELAFVKDEERIYVGKNGEKNVPMANYEELFDITKEINDARGGEETLELNLKNIENRMAENVAKQYLEVSTNNGHMKVENCFNGLTKDIKIKGRTLQNLASKDLCGQTGGNWVDNGFIRATGKSDWVAVRMGSISQCNLIKPNTKYIVITEISKNTLDGMFYTNVPSSTRYFSGQSTINKGTTGVFVEHLTTISKTDSIIYGIYPSVHPTSTTGEIIFRQIILEGEQQETSYFEGIKSLGEGEDKISILSTGKNLFKFRIGSISNGAETTSENSFTVNSTGGWSLNSEIFTLFEDTTISLSFIENLSSNAVGAQILNADNSVYGSINKDTPRPIVKGSYKIKFARKHTENTIGTVDNIQLELNSKTPYEPYKANKKDILLPVSNGAKGLGNVTDEQYANGDYLQKIGAITFNENSEWFIVANDENTIRFAQLPNGRPSIKPASYCMCDKFINTPADKDIEMVRVDSSNPHGVINIRILKSKLETPDVAGFKKWLGANPTTIVYELFESILHKAEVEQNNNLATFKEITHVSCLNKIAPSSMSAKFPVDMAGTISRLNKENIELENKNIELENNNLELNEKIINQAIYFNEQAVDLATTDFETDFRLMEIEFALDIPLNLNMKGMKNMAARTPYEMAKIVILGGNYERADMEYKLSVYVKRGRMTQEEHDELIGLMDAREIVEK